MHEKVNSSLRKEDSSLKGLIIKDLMCLRKQMSLFIGSAIGVLVVAILVLLSMKYGNLATAVDDMMSDGLCDKDIRNIVFWVMLIIMLVPTAAIGDVAVIFEQDGKSGFINVAAAMPVSITKRVTARFLLIFGLFGLSLIIDIIMSFILSCFTDFIVFSEFAGGIIAILSLLISYCSLVALFIAVFGYGHEDYASAASVFALFIAIGTAFALLANQDLNVDKLFSFIKTRSYILLAISVLVMGISYAVTLILAKRKRGVL